MSHIIALNGPVGVGKSTILNQLKLHLPNCYIVPEYYDALDDASIKLNNYLNNELSAFEFQSYILDYFESIIDQLKDSTYDYIIIERTPIEGIEFFAKLDLINHRMTQEEYDILYNRAQSLTFYPNSSIDESITIFTDSLLPHQILPLIIAMLPRISIVNLRASFETLKERIKQRGRLCELEYYDDHYLRTMIDFYN